MSKMCPERASIGAPLKTLANMLRLFIIQNQLTESYLKYQKREPQTATERSNREKRLIWSRENVCRRVCLDKKVDTLFQTTVKHQVKVHVYGSLSIKRFGKG